jgi:hypothetical protein
LPHWTVHAIPGKKPATMLRESAMNPSEIERLQTYLRKLFKSDLIKVVPPMRKGLSVELSVNEEIVGTVHKDTDDGETSYSILISVLEEDLPAVKAPVKPAGASPRR